MDCIGDAGERVALLNSQRSSATLIKSGPCLSATSERLGTGTGHVDRAGRGTNRQIGDVSVGIPVPGYAPCPAAERERLGARKHTKGADRDVLSVPVNRAVPSRKITGWALCEIILEANDNSASAATAKVGRPIENDSFGGDVDGPRCPTKLPKISPTGDGHVCGKG